MIKLIISLIIAHILTVFLSFSLLVLTTVALIKQAEEDNTELRPATRESNIIDKLFAFALLTLPGINIIIVLLLTVFSDKFYNSRYVPRKEPKDL